MAEDIKAPLTADKARKLLSENARLQGQLEALAPVVEPLERARADYTEILERVRLQSGAISSAEATTSYLLAEIPKDLEQAGVSDLSVLSDKKGATDASVRAELKAAALESARITYAQLEKGYTGRKLEEIRANMEYAGLKADDYTALTGIQDPAAAKAAFDTQVKKGYATDAKIAYHDIQQLKKRNTLYSGCDHTLVESLEKSGMKLKDLDPGVPVETIKAEIDYFTERYSSPQLRERLEHIPTGKETSAVSSLRNIALAAASSVKNDASWLTAATSDAAMPKPADSKLILVSNNMALS